MLASGWKFVRYKPNIANVLEYRTNKRQRGFKEGCRVSNTMRNRVVVALAALLATSAMVAASTADAAAAAAACDADASTVEPAAGEQCNEASLDVAQQFPASIGPTQFTAFCGGWDSYRNDEANTGWADVETPSNVRQAWRKNGLNKGTHTAAKASAILVNDTLMVAGDSGVLYAYDRLGNVKWAGATFPSLNGIHGTPSVIRELGLAFIGAYDGGLYAFRLADGSLAWRAQAGEYIGASPIGQPFFGRRARRRRAAATAAAAAAAGTALPDDSGDDNNNEGDAGHRVVITVEYDSRFKGDTAHGAIVALDAVTGAELARFEGRGHSHSSAGYDAASHAYAFGSNGGCLYIVEADDLALRHELCLPTRFPSPQPHAKTPYAIKGPIAVAHGQAVFGAWDGYIYSVNMARGDVKWRVSPSPLLPGQRLSSGVGIDRDNRTGFVGCGKGVVALDLDTGAVLWLLAKEAGFAVTGSVTVTRNAVVFGSQDGKVYAVDKATGAVIWDFIAGRTGQITSTPLVTPEGDVVFASRSYKGKEECFGVCTVPGALHYAEPDTTPDGGGSTAAEAAVGAAAAATATAAAATAAALAAGAAAGAPAAL
jgi:outer membrane protein assembly factor BamB